MNFRERIAYVQNWTRNKPDSNCVKVESPSSLRQMKIMSMYVPRQDKFEGYAQFPRPRLPNETSSPTQSRRPVIGEIFFGKKKLSVKEQLELRDKRTKERENITRKTQDFLKKNIGFLTGTKTGASAASIFTTKESWANQNDDLVLPRYNSSTLKQIYGRAKKSYGSSPRGPLRSPRSPKD